MPERDAGTLSVRSILGVGVIGCGTIAYWQHLRTLRRMADIRVVALADPDSEALARANALVDAPGFGRFEQLLRNDDVDAVVIASPAGLHARQLLEASAAGKHCYVEKPLAHDADALAEVTARIDGRGPVVAVGYNNRFHPGCRQLRNAIAGGQIGEVRALVSHFTETFDADALPPWRQKRAQGGGVLLDLATHHVDLYRWLLEDELIRCHARTASRRSEQDSALLTAVTRGGIELSGYFAHGPSRSHAITAHGTNGVLRLDLHRGRLILLRNRRLGYGVRSRTAWPSPLDLSWRFRRRLQPSFDPSHGRCLQAFIRAAQSPSQRHPDLAGLAEGAAALRAVLEAEDAEGGVAGPMPKAV